MDAVDLAPIDSPARVCVSELAALQDLVALWRHVHGGMHGRDGCYVLMVQHDWVTLEFVHVHAPAVEVLSHWYMIYSFTMQRLPLVYIYPIWQPRYPGFRRA